MAEVQPPLYLQNVGNYNAVQDRRAWQALTFEGVAGFNVSQGDLAVAPNSPTGWSVLVRRGGGMVQGDDVQDQGMYFVYNDAQKTLTITPSDPAQDRTDLIVARIRDSAAGIAGDTWALEVVQGTYGAGVPATPASALLLAQVAVAHGTSSVSSSMITDKRKKLITSLASGAEVASVYLNSGSRTIASDGNEHKILVETVQKDDYGYFTAGSNRFTVPTGHGGTFRAGGQVQYQSASGGQRRGVIYVNGSTDVGRTLIQASPSSGAPLTIPIQTPPFVMSDGDTLELWGFQDSGGVLSLNPGRGTTFFWLERIGG